MNIEILKDIRVLYVEDEVDLLENFASLIDKTVGEVVTAKNGLEGLELYQNSLNNPDAPIDIILTDINMPKMNGLEMIEKIREFDHLVPIIIVSAYDDHSFLKHSIDLGVSGYSLKPIDMVSVVKTMIRAYESSYLRKTLEQQVQQRTKDIEVFKRAVDSVETGITLADAAKEDMPLIYANKTFEKITEYKHEDAIGKNCRFLQGDDKDQEELEAVRDAIKNQTSCDVELRNYTKSGKMFWNHLIITPLFDEVGALEYFVGIQHDITKQKELYQNLEKFIDTQDNIVILTDGEKIKFANKQFFNFLDFKSLKDFLLHHDCICELFIENNKFFHLGKIDSDQNWANEIQKLPNNKRVVSILGKDFIPHAFSVNINKFDEKTFIISFTDISDTMIENINLKNKVIHDPLTGAYNREYFEKNYRLLINRYHTTESKLAIALLDIDHFKLVNDNYGHDVGDEVLIHFVKTVQKFSRDEDIFIRWGGEEFVFILKVKSKEDLGKALEHLRKTIEMQEFPTIGQKTCSIGGTLYKSGEDIYTSIKRADEAVYEAKESGRNKVVIH
jgi:diguanylate cyclase (GGDEF)-like protein/PAS domain S-box-containing protein